jgi:NAD-specific glutamate dehydrogenase
MDKDQEILRLQRQLSEAGRTINDLRDELLKVKQRLHDALSRDEKKDMQEKIRAAYEQGKADAFTAMS